MSSESTILSSSFYVIFFIFQHVNMRWLKRNERQHHQYQVCFNHLHTYMNKESQVRSPSLRYCSFVLSLMRAAVLCECVKDSSRLLRRNTLRDWIRYALYTLWIFHIHSPQPGVFANDVAEATKLICRCCLRLLSPRKEARRILSHGDNYIVNSQRARGNSPKREPDSRRAFSH